MPLTGSVTTTYVHPAAENSYDPLTCDVATVVYTGSGFSGLELRPGPPALINYDIDTRTFTFTASFADIGTTAFYFTITDGSNQD